MDVIKDELKKYKKIAFSNKEKDNKVE